MKAAPRTTPDVARPRGSYRRVDSSTSANLLHFYALPIPRTSVMRHYLTAGDRTRLLPPQKQISNLMKRESTFPLCQKRFRMRLSSHRSWTSVSFGSILCVLFKTQNPIGLRSLQRWTSTTAGHISTSLLPNPPILMREYF